MKIRLLILFLFFGISTFAQITTVPELPVASQSVTFTFNSAEESRLGYFTGDLYAHTGVIIEENGDWTHVIGNWGDNSAQPQLTNKGNGIYELVISPDINSFYSVLAEENVIQIACVFRSADASQQTNDIYINIYEDGLVVEITNPVSNSILAKNQPLTIEASASVEADLKLYVNELLLDQTTGTNISTSTTFSESGNFWLIAEATSNNETVTDSISVFVRNNISTETKPTEYKNGINYPTDTSAALVLWAPLKEFVFVLGDFNNWQPDNDYQMKKDGDYFWLEISNLEKGKEYIFQYFIDGDIKVADPYTEKIVDPWNDSYIDSVTYPNLIKYPENKTEGIASVLQPGQDEFSWEVSDFQVPEKERLIIYELLVRDFTTEHTYKAVRENLDYLEDLNINVLELMPVNEFEGNSSWGYNPAFYFAPDKYYGSKNELKKLIDECHKRGIAVVIDMVLNHSYGQSPFVQMYMDNWTITAENPWFNEEHNFQNTAAHWGFDFNHESEATRELVDSVASFWMNEYKIDGFRFDFTKGFSNTVYGPSSWGSDYDAERISNLKRMTDEIRKKKSDALVIFEHLAENSEETELANYGIFLWGNMHGNYQEAARGNTGSSDLSWAMYTARGWDEPNLVSYPESHDEERIMIVLKNTGLVDGDYNIKNQQTALDRIELNSVFHLLLPGPKMIWQFGERGYDISINDFGGRLAEKPPYWQYLNNTNRTDLFRVMSKLNYLKQTYLEFDPHGFTYNLSGELKFYTFTRGENHVVAVGNFGTQENSINIDFPATGKWYRFFTEDSVDISSVSQQILLAPGEYRLYSTRKYEQPHIVTENKDLFISEHKVIIYPNPVQNEIHIQAEKTISQVVIYSVTGELIQIIPSLSEKYTAINVKDYKPGIYLIQIFQDKKISTKKFIKKE